MVGASPRRGGLELTVEAGELAGKVTTGGSVAVDGVCLTVVAVRGGKLIFDLSPESLERTTAGSLKAGRPVNLEAALRMGDPLGGHLVSGHIDGVAKVAAVRRTGGFFEVGVTLPRAMAGGVAEKGSIALDGVSLTVASVHSSGVRVAVIPETARRTTVGSWRAGRLVNVELEKGPPAVQVATLTRSGLAEHGFA